MEPDTEDCLEYALVQLEPPRDAVYKLLEKLEDRNGLFIAGLIRFCLLSSFLIFLAGDRGFILICGISQRYISLP